MNDKPEEQQINATWTAAMLDETTRAVRIVVPHEDVRREVESWASRAKPPKGFRLGSRGAIETAARTVLPYVKASIVERLTPGVLAEPTVAKARTSDKPQVSVTAMTDVGLEWEILVKVMPPGSYVDIPLDAVQHPGSVAVGSYVPRTDGGEVTVAACPQPETPPCACKLMLGEAKPGEIHGPAACTLIDPSGQPKEAVVPG